jgi:hypothetical protein
MEQIEQICRNCKKNKSLENFSIVEPKSLRRRLKCRDCRNKQMKLYYEKNKDKMNKISKEYRIKNKDELNQKITCVCGGKYTICNKSRHYKSRKHNKYYNLLNSTKINCLLEQ